MKKSEFRNLIREEVRKVMEENLNESNEILIPNLSDIDHTRIIKWLGGQFHSHQYDMKKKTGKDFVIDTKGLSKSELEDLKSYLKSQEYIKESEINESEDPRVKKSELRQIVREEISKVMNEFGPMYGSQNKLRTSTNPLVKTIDTLDRILSNSTKTPFKAAMEWERKSEELLGDNNYWNELDNSELEEAIDVARSIIDKYNIKP
jgi:hypothetical protein